MSAGSWVVVAAGAVALAFGAWRLLTDGRFTSSGRRPSGGTAPEPARSSAGLLEQTPWAEELGERATLLQFSSAFCAPCRATRRVLSDVAANHDGVAHVEVDAEAHLELVRRLGILRTPTTLVLDADGRELVRAAGAPSRSQVESALPG